MAFVERPESLTAMSFSQINDAMSQGLHHGAGQFLPLD